MVLLEFYTKEGINIRSLGGLNIFNINFNWSIIMEGILAGKVVGKEEKLKYWI